jgi:uncharacterized protein YdhG (YjbR/CyaY superfamily)
MAKTDFKSVNEYILSRPEAVRGILRRLRSIIRKAIPSAEEGISYQIPAYKVNGRPALYFAGWKEHYSLYPASTHLVAALKEDLAPYKLSKGTIRFPLSEPIPVKLIEKIAKVRAREVAERDKPKKMKSRGGTRAPETQLERVRRICNSMPSAFEKLSHGSPTFFVQKDKGVFTMFADNHHSDGHLAVWMPAPSGLQAELINEAPATYFKPAYVGSSGWIGIELDQITDEVLTLHIRQAWKLALPKKKTGNGISRPR